MGKNKILLISIATAKYSTLISELYNSYEEYFLPNIEKDYLIFTDLKNNVPDRNNILTAHTKHKAYPYTTLLRYETILNERSMLTKYDYIFYIDADTYCYSLITETDLFKNIKSFIGVKHPWFRNGLIGPFERNQKSTAYVEDKACLHVNYIQGCFWGGNSKSIITMLEELREKVRIDLRKGIIAVWHDESHLNKFSATNRGKFKYLHPGFSIPLGWNIKVPKKIIHINENTLDTLKK